MQHKSIQAFLKRFRANKKQIDFIFPFNKGLNN